MRNLHLVSRAFVVPNACQFEPPNVSSGKCYATSRKKRHRALWGNAHAVPLVVIKGRLCGAMHVKDPLMVFEKVSHTVWSISVGCILR